MKKKLYDLGYKQSYWRSVLQTFENNTVNHYLYLIKMILRLEDKKLVKLCESVELLQNMSDSTLCSNLYRLKNAKNYSINLSQKGKKLLEFFELQDD